MTAIQPLPLEGDVIAEVTALLGGLGAGGLGVALVTGVFGRRKNKADAVAVLTQAAAAMVEPLSKQLAAQAAALEEHKRADAERERRRRIRAARHIQWDNQLRDRLEQLGVPVDPPPPLEDIAP